MNLPESVSQLAQMSNRYGANEAYVLAGGGNTSTKQGGVLYVKGSGAQLATIRPEEFVRMDMAALLAMLEKPYPGTDAEREAAALADMMAAMLPGQAGKRPSVECLLHAVFPQSFVLHVHPALVNGLTCGQNGEAECRRLLGEKALWVPLTKPGYVLGKACHEAFKAHEAAFGQAPTVVLLQNHGIFVAAESVEGIDETMRRVMDALQSAVRREPDMAPTETLAPALELAPALRALYANTAGCAVALPFANAELLRFAESETAMAPLLAPFTPDHIVYCKARPLYLQAGDDIQPAFDAFITQNGYAPKIAVVQGIGLFALGKTRKEADIARRVFLDGLRIAVYAESFGGPLHLPEEFVQFILHWEVESYRQKISLGTGSTKRMQGKVCLVTGAAQGFGEGIAAAIAAEGGSVVIADMNEAGAAAGAQKLNDLYGEGTALGVPVNVADEASVEEMIRRTLLHYGGLDVLVACAGIAIAGGLAEMTRDKFEKVTAVNYTGYFLCAKYAAVPMKIQHRYAPGTWCDIIEINSKSGLAGSKNNFAYAGSKFGGVGLTQSFALELVDHGIKVNAICPGNLLDGPLWSDPERGLFRQYLEAGKVPGATCVADVRAFYEAKVPMGRGCTTGDVAKAVFYVVEQQYETGQALPVTGGQVMLK